MVALVYGACLPFWLRFCSWLRGAYYAAALLLFLAGVLTLAAAPCGVLWELHDMEAGYFPSARQMEATFINGAQISVGLVWPLAVYSIPLNIVARICALMLTHQLTRRYTREPRIP